MSHDHQDVDPVLPRATIDTTPSPIAVRWEDWIWPDWVHEPVRTVVRAYWRGGHRGGPAHWLADARQRDAPELGATVRVAQFAGLQTDAHGRYVHCHTNIGRVLHEDGRVSLVYLMTGAVRWVKFMGNGNPGGW